jgi:hypothetical protein
MKLTIDDVLDAASALGSGSSAYMGAYGGWVASLGIFGKLGLAVGVVHPPLGLAAAAVVAGIAAFTGSRMRRPRARKP